MTVGEDPAEQAQARLLAPAAGIAFTLDCAHPLDVAPYDCEEQVESGGTTGDSTHRVSL